MLMTFPQMELNGTTPMAMVTVTIRLGLKAIGFLMNKSDGDDETTIVELIKMRHSRTMDHKLLIQTVMFSATNQMP